MVRLGQGVAILYVSSGTHGSSTVRNQVRSKRVFLVHTATCSVSTEANS